MSKVIPFIKAWAPDAANTDIHANAVAQRNAKKHAHANGDIASKPYATSLPHVAVTLERQPYLPRAGDKLIDPGVARVNIAASRELPDGTPGWAEDHAHQTVLQQHCTYWDPDNDGIIYPWDIYLGCRAWGWNPILCLIAVLAIAPTMSYPTLPRGQYLPDAWFRIYLNNIHKNKHGSDSNTYDSAGRFRPQQFEDFMTQYDADGKGGLDIFDIARALKGQRVTTDPFGWTAGLLEWLALYLLVWPDDGVVRKEDVRASYDGSLFQRKADEVAAKKRRAIKQ